MKPQPKISSKQWGYLECAALLPPDVSTNARAVVVIISFWLPLLTCGPIHSSSDHSLAVTTAIRMFFFVFPSSTLQWPCKGKRAESFIHYLRLHGTKCFQLLLSHCPMTGYLNQYPFHCLKSTILLKCIIYGILTSSSVLWKPSRDWGIWHFDGT